jgi:hypothetical protein
MLPGEGTRVVSFGKAELKFDGDSKLAEIFPL